MYYSVNDVRLYLIGLSVQKKKINENPEIVLLVVLFWKAVAKSIWIHFSSKALRTIGGPAQYLTFSKDLDIFSTSVLFTYIYLAFCLTYISCFCIGLLLIFEWKKQIHIITYGVLKGFPKYYCLFRQLITKRLLYNYIHVVALQNPHEQKGKTLLQIITGVVCSF